jgi:hypothetical protein
VRFLLTTLLACGAISVAPAQPADTTPTADEKKAIDLVTRAGGKAEIDPNLPVASRVAAKFEYGADALLVNLKKAPQVGALDIFDATRCTDQGLAALKDLPNLRRLTLGKSFMNPPRLKAIAQCKQLRRLYLAGCGLSDAGLELLKPLSNLVWLDISDNPHVTDKGMASLKELERLQALFLAKTSITDKGLTELKGLDGLRQLNVVATKVSGDAAEKFADEMPNLRGVRR